MNCKGCANPSVFKLICYYTNGKGLYTEMYKAYPCQTHVEDHVQYGVPSFDRNKTFYSLSPIRTDNEQLPR